jgi:L-ascorbate metabolism protein UlaG (beta-lactamase superfamily)
MNINVDIDEVMDELDAMDKKLKAAVSVYAETVGAKLTSEAKRNAKWTDRTALARQSITSSFNWKGNTCTIYVSGNTDYFPYLELANEKRLAVLYPVIQENYTSVFDGFSKLMGL